MTIRILGILREAGHVFDEGCCFTTARAPALGGYLQIAPAREALRHQSGKNPRRYLFEEKRASGSHVGAREREGEGEGEGEEKRNLRWYHTGGIFRVTFSIAT